MKPLSIEPERIRGAWAGRISGCQLGKPVEVLSMLQGHQALTEYLEKADALPLRNYVPLIEGTIVDKLGRNCCLGHLERAEPDDDINYTVLALLLLEEKGAAMQTADVARAWLRLLPAGATFTAERAAYRTLLNKAHEHFSFGADAGFDLAECADNEFNDWIGAQIRADLYGWVAPGRPALAAELARRDASLSHRGEGIYGAVFVAALGAAIPATSDLGAAIDVALCEIPGDSEAAAAVKLGRDIAGAADAVATIHARYEGMSPVHTVNNLALVVWALCAAVIHGDTSDGSLEQNPFSVAVGDVVTAGWDTDCNGATVGGLYGLLGRPIPKVWTEAWRGRVGVSLAGISELDVEELVERTIQVAKGL